MMEGFSIDNAHSHGSSLNPLIFLNIFLELWVSELDILFQQQSHPFHIQKIKITSPLLHYILLFTHPRIKVAFWPASCTLEAHGQLIIYCNPLNFFGIIASQDRTSLNCLIWPEFFVPRWIHLYLFIIKLKSPASAPLNKQYRSF